MLLLNASTFTSHGLATEHPSQRTKTEPPPTKLTRPSLILTQQRDRWCLYTSRYFTDNSSGVKQTSLMTLRKICTRLCYPFSALMSLSISKGSVYIRIITWDAPFISYGCIVHFGYAGDKPKKGKHKLLLKGIYTFLTVLRRSWCYVHFPLDKLSFE